MLKGWLLELPAMLGLPADALPMLLACGAVIITLFAWALREPKVPPKPKQCGVLDAKGVLWRSDSVGTLVSVPEDGITHVWACIERTAQRFPHKRGIGQRPLLKREIVPDPANPSKHFEKLSFGEYEWLTFKEYRDRACDFAAGMVAFTGLPSKANLVVYGETQRDWMVAALGAFRQGIAVVTIYATLGEDGVVHGITQTKASAVVADSKLLPVLLACAPRCKTLKHVITLSPSIDPKDRAQLEALGVAVRSMEELIKDGRAQARAPAPVAPSDPAVIMYTSGTTGMPKGVVITHANFIAAVSGMQQALFSFTRPDDVFLAYLPLAHIMEMAAEVTQMYFGTAIGYGSPHTLTSTGVKLAAGQVGDAPLLRPTVMVFAPAVLDKVFQGVKLKVSHASPFAQKLFGWALAAGIANYERGGIGAGALYNALVFKKIQMLLGGRVRAMITGSAPLSPDVQKFVQTVFSCPVRQGYGLTETCAASVLAFLGDNASSTVGAPSAAACIRLRDWAEGGYTFADKDKPDVQMPRGEVLIGGPMVTAGYLIDPEAPDAEVAAKNETEYAANARGAHSARRAEQRQRARAQLDTCQSVCPVPCAVCPVPCAVCPVPCALPCPTRL